MERKNPINEDRPSRQQAGAMAVYFEAERLNSVIELMVENGQYASLKKPFVDTTRGVRE